MTNDPRHIKRPPAAGVDWWKVHEFVAFACGIGPSTCWPVAGSPAWCALDDDDETKLAAVLDAGRQRALDLHTRETEAARAYDEWVAIESRRWAEAEASHDFSTGEDWSAIATYIRQRKEFLSKNPWAKRRSA